MRTIYEVWLFDWDDSDSWGLYETRPLAEHAIALAKQHGESHPLDIRERQLLGAMDQALDDAAIIGKTTMVTE